MAERLIAAVLKTAVRDERSGGSNPSLSALVSSTTLKAPVYGAFVILVYHVNVNCAYSLAQRTKITCISINYRGLN